MVDPVENSEATEVLDDGVEDFEDTLAIHDSEPRAQKYSLHILVNGKQVSKASILKDLMQHRSPRLSTDRTKRVAGIPAFANQLGSDRHRIAFDGPTGAPCPGIYKQSPNRNAWFDKNKDWMDSDVAGLTIKL
ncbi:hypothetical protein B0H14DRAFT_2563389 [Mycena olivaceomarginata]|nr:hypothetical protein B0H14DRAFT_2563389 [Mycena olivaceomarginata]